MNNVLAEANTKIYMHVYRYISSLDYYCRIICQNKAKLDELGNQVMINTYNQWMPWHRYMYIRCRLYHSHAQNMVFLYVNVCLYLNVNFVILYVVVQRAKRKTAVAILVPQFSYFNFHMNFSCKLSVYIYICFLCMKIENKFYSIYSILCITSPMTT